MTVLFLRRDRKAPFLGFCRPVTFAAATSIAGGAVLVLLLLVGSCSPVVAFGSGVMLAIQALGGSLLYLHVFPMRFGDFARTLGLGIVLGSLMAALSSQMVLRGLGIEGLGWWVPTAMMLMSPYSWRVREASSVPNLRKSAVLVGFSALPGLLSLLMVWRLWPVSVEGWWPLDGDLSSHGSVAASVGSFGPEKSLSLLGSGFQYHWFSHVWVDLFTTVVTDDYLVSFTRVLLAVSFIAALALLWVLAGFVSKNPQSRAFGVAMALGASYVTTGVAHAGSLLVEPLSPTFSFGLVVFLGVTVVVIDVVACCPSRRTVKAAQLSIATFLAFGLIGSRVFFAGALVGGLAGVLLLSIKRRRMRFMSCLVGAASFVGAVVAYYLITSPKTLRIASDGLQIQVNSDLAALLGAIPINSVLGLWLGTASAVLSALAGAAGVLWFFVPPGRMRRRRAELLVAWVLGGLFVGTMATLASRQGGYSQLSFLSAAMVLAYLVGGAGAGNALTHVLRDGLFANGKGGRLAVWLIGPIVIGILVAVTWPKLQDFRFSGAVRFLVPFLVVVLIVIYAFVTQGKNGIAVKHARLGLIVSAISVVVLSVSLTNVLLRWPLSVELGNPYQEAAISQDYLDAGAWVRGATPKNAIFATNRQCNLPDDVFPECSSGTFITSPLARRQVLIEGYTYSLGHDAKTVQSERPMQTEWIMVSSEFGKSPSEESYRTLRDLGVTHFWVDKLLPHADTWGPQSKVVFENKRVLVLEFTHQ